MCISIISKFAVLFLSCMLKLRLNIDKHELFSALKPCLGHEWTSTKDWAGIAEIDACLGDTQNRGHETYKQTHRGVYRDAL